MREYHRGGGAELRSEEMQMSCLHRMLPVKPDGSKEHFDLVEHAGSYEELKVRIDRRISSIRAGLHFKKPGLNNTPENESGEHGEEGGGEVDVEDALNALFNHGLDSEDCDELYAALRQGNCHNCGRPGHFASECWEKKGKGKGKGKGGGGGKSGGKGTRGRRRKGSGSEKAQSKH